MKIGADPFLGGGNRDRISSCLHLTILPDTVGIGGLTALGNKENPVGFGLPAAVVLPPAGDSVVFAIYFDLSGFQIPAGPDARDIAGDIMPQVEKDMGFFGLRESEPVNSRVFRGGQFHPDIIAGQPDRIIMGHRYFLRLFRVMAFFINGQPDLG